MEIGSNTVLVLVQDNQGYYEWVDQEELKAAAEWYDELIERLKPQTEKD